MAVAARTPEGPTAAETPPAFPAVGGPTPTPVELPRPSRTTMAKRGAATLLAFRRFAPLVGRRLARRPVEQAAGARALREVFEDLGATYVKFGQLVGSAPGVFGEAISDEFRSCLDTGPPVPFDEVRSVVESDLGTTLETAFAQFESEPTAAGSIAVVHRAVTHDGRPVAVKVLRPGIEALIATDLQIMQPLLDFVARQVGMVVVGPMVRALGVFRQQVSEELDLRNEAVFMAHYRQLLAGAGVTEVAVPDLHDGLSARRVLTMEWLDGVPIDHPAMLDLGVDPRPLLEAGLKAWFLAAIRDGFFHGDVHAGNFLVLRDGRIGLIDWGIVGRLDPDMHTFFRNVVRAGLGDDDAWIEVGKRLTQQFGLGMQQMLDYSDEQMAQFFRSQIEPILTSPFGEVSLAAMFTGPVDEINRHDEEQGFTPGKGPLGAVRRLRRIRRMRQSGTDTELGGFDLSSFLLQKQLLYFERYGKMFLADRPLLADEQFFRAALAAPPILAPES